MFSIANIIFILLLFPLPISDKWMVRKLNNIYLSNYQHITQIYPSYESGFN